MAEIESHPFEPFLPGNAKVLMFGSFPPPESRWSMKFYYPNKTNDMWRIMGLVFYNDKDKFIVPGGYDEDAIRRFASERGIAMYDAAVKVIRQKGNASDKFLQIVEPIDLFGFLDRLPECRTIMTAGEKSAAMIAQLTGTLVPATGCAVAFNYNGRGYMQYRMVSSSRAYPMPVEEKARRYAAVFSTIYDDIYLKF